MESEGKITRFAGPSSDAEKTVSERKVQKRPIPVSVPAAPYPSSLWSPVPPLSVPGPAIPGNFNFDLNQRLSLRAHLGLSRERVPGPCRPLVATEGSSTLHFCPVSVPSYSTLEFKNVFCSRAQGPSAGYKNE